MGTVTLPRAVSLGASRSSRTGFERKEFPWKVLLDTLLGVEKWTGRQWEAAACAVAQCLLVTNKLVGAARASFLLIMISPALVLPWLSALAVCPGQRG